MTLSKQLMLLVLSLFVLVFVGTFAITVNNSKNYFAQQLESNAKDTATSLGLSLSQPMAQKDKATMLSMVTAIFDRGYFSKIQIVDMSGNVIIERKIKLTSPKIPALFLKFIKLDATQKSAIIMKGWHQVGRVIVVTNPGYVYQDIWSNTKGIFYWYSLLTIILLIGGASTIRYLFKPLKNVVAQAEGICNKEFKLEKNIPKTVELRRVTIAMNKMVKKLRKVFSENAKQTEMLRSQAFQDPLTGIGNRRFFDNQLAHLLPDEEAFTPGFLVMIEIDGLNEYNHQNGYQAGDELIQELNKGLIEVYDDFHVASYARLSGSTFAAIVFETEQTEVEKLVYALVAQCQLVLSGHDASLIASVGAVSYQQSMDASLLLSECDEALRFAHEKGQFACHVQLHEDHKEHRTSAEWQQIIVDAIAHKHFAYYTQRVEFKGKNLHQELFIRLLEDGDKEVLAGKFLPVAEKYGLGFEIDKLVLNFAKQHLTALESPLALNISSTTLKEKSNRNKYLELLSAFPEAFRHLLSFEFSESNVMTHFEEMKEFVKDLHELGYEVGIDKVGSNFTPLYYIGELKIDYVKLDGSLSQDITENSSKQFYIHNLSGTAKTMDVKVIVTNIDDGELWEIFKGLNISGGQGIFLSPIDKIN